MAKGPQNPTDQIEVELAPGAALPLSPNGATESIDVADLPSELEPLAAEEEETPSEEITPPPWGETSVEDVLNHEALAPFLTEREDALREEVRRDYYNRLQPLITQRNQQLQAVSSQAQAFIRQAEKAARDGTMDETLLDRYEDTAQKISGAYWHVGRFDGAKALVLELGNALEDDSLLDDFRPRIELLEAGGEDPKLFGDLIARLNKKADGKSTKESDQKGYERGLAEGRKAAIEELKAQARAGQGPDLTRKTPGAGSVLTLERYRNLSPDELAKLAQTPAGRDQIDRMTAEVARSYSR